jgi:hypothetical protein
MKIYAVGTMLKNSADESGFWGNSYKLPGCIGMEGGMGANCVAYVFIFLNHIIIFQLYKLTLSDQAQITLQLKVALSKLVQRILISPPILGDPKPTP